MIGSYYDRDLYEDDLAELRAEARAERRYQNVLSRHPDCRDPDHPGCECCEERDEDEDEEDDE